jgi:DNA-directed RNA polymerase subunit D
MIKKIIKTDEKIVFTSDMTLTLANALRRSANEIPILAIDEVDIYKNDSALYDEVLAHRMALIPLKNRKVKEGEFVEMKLNVKANGKQIDVLSGEFGDESVIKELPLTILDKNQEVTVVAKAKQGKGIEHSKYSPGLVFYKILSKIEIGKDAEKRQELAEIYPEVFSFDGGKLTVKNDWKFDLDVEDLKEFEGIKVTPTENIVYTIEAYGQIPAEEIFEGAVKALGKNLEEVSKALK